MKKAIFFILGTDRKFHTEHTESTEIIGRCKEISHRAHGGHRDNRTLKENFTRRTQSTRRVFTDLFKINPKGRRDVHAFQHTYDTMLKQRISNETLKYLLGHKTDKMLEHYDHTEELQRLKRYRDEVKKIDEIF